MSRTLQELAKEALEVQDACNLSGVVHGFSRAITDLRKACPHLGTDELNHHPICILWADKIAHLTGTQVCGHDTVTDAYPVVSELAEPGVTKEIHNG